MVCGDHMWRGRALRIVVGTLLVFLVFAGGAGALSNGGGGSWAYSHEITIINPGAAPAVDDGGVGGRRGGGWV